jgi:hypothetical protein
MDDYHTCGAVRPALVVAVVTVFFAALLGLAGRRQASPLSPSPKGRRWLILLAGLILLGGTVTAIWLAVGVRHLCGTMGVFTENVSCGATRPAKVVAFLTLFSVAILVYAGMKRKAPSIPPR